MKSERFQGNRFFHIKNCKIWRHSNKLKGAPSLKNAQPCRGEGGGALPQLVILAWYFSAILFFFQSAIRCQDGPLSPSKICIVSPLGLKKWTCAKFGFLPTPPSSPPNMIGPVVSNMCFNKFLTCYFLPWKPIICLFLVPFPLNFIWFLGDTSRKKLLRMTKIFNAFCFYREKISPH